jgi:hypothetical protein
MWKRDVSPQQQVEEEFLVLSLLVLLNQLWLLSSTLLFCGGSS